MPELLGRHIRVDCLALQGRNRRGREVPDSILHAFRQDPSSSRPKFQSGVTFTKALRNHYHIIEDCPICACADFIREKRWCDRYEVQLIAI